MSSGLGLRALLLLIATAGSAAAQSNPGWTLGQVPTPAQWNQQFTLKADVLNGTLTNPTISGQTVFNNPLQLTRSPTAQSIAMIASGVSNPLNSLIWSQGSWSGTLTGNLAPLHQFFCSANTIALDALAHASCLNVQHNAGGAGFTGNPTGASFVMTQVGASGNKARGDGSAFWVGAAAAVQMDFNDGGSDFTQTNSYGDAFGIGVSGNCRSGATFLHGCSGAEIDYSLGTGASARFFNALQLVKLPVSQTQGAIFDGVVIVADQVGSAQTRDCIFCIGTPFGQFPAASTASLIQGNIGVGAVPAVPASLAYGLDTLQITYGTAFLASRGFSVDGGTASGAIMRLGTTTFTAGATGLAVSANGAVATAETLNAGGTGCGVGDRLFFGTEPGRGIATVNTVTAGAVATFTMYRQPYDYSGAPPATLAMNGTQQRDNTCAGVVLNVTWNTVANTLSLQPATGAKLGLYNAVPVVRAAGYAAMTGTPNKAAVYDTTTVTLPQLAGRIMQLQADLAAIGVIGP